MFIRHIGDALRLAALSFALSGCMSPLSWVFAQSDAKRENELLGRWDVQVAESESASSPAWFEFRKSGYRTIVGSFVGASGSARPISEVEVKEDTFRFVIPPQWENRESHLVFEGRWQDGRLTGTTNRENGDTIHWQATRAPELPPSPTLSWSKPIELFNGQDLAGWKTQFSGKKNGWKVIDGILTNAEPGNNLISEQQFRNFKLHAEFRYPSGSNGGIYLRGRYEVQIIDSPNERPNDHNIGSIYGFLTPSVNAAAAAGQWQEIDIELNGRQVTIELNGQRIIDRQSIPGITGGALDSDEGSAGPLLLQGDHGPIEFRKLTVWEQTEG